MRRILIVSPHFPPVSLPDMQRVRMSLPYFEQFGWHPTVLAVEPDPDAVLDPLLPETVPAGTDVRWVRPLSKAVSRRFGVGNPALRAWHRLYAEGARLLKDGQVDLAYFSTTMFMSMPLGRIWKRRFGTPFVLDMQDPWLSDYYETHPDAQAPPKYGLARRVHATLEPWTMQAADGLIAVSPSYIDVLQGRYPRLRAVPCLTLPFAATPADFALLDQHPQPNRQFAHGDGALHGVYAGRGGDDLSTALDITFRALRLGLAARPDLFERVRLHFLGTDYSTGGRARKTVEPVAASAGVGAYVREVTSRLPYFEALQTLRDADFLLVTGSDDAAYTASKVYPYVLARKPLLAVVHERSTVVDVVREVGAGHVVTFPSGSGDAERALAATALAEVWTRVLEGGAAEPATDWRRFERFTAVEMTRQQCALFDRVVGAQRRSAA